MLKMKAVAAMVPLLLLVAACGGADVEPADASPSAHVADQTSSAEQSSDASEDVDLPSDDTLMKYFEAVAARSLSGYEDAITASVPGSLAQAYAKYLKAYIQALTDAGVPFPSFDTNVKKVNDGYKFCTAAGQNKQCYTATNITGRDGKVANFSLNGKPLKHRLSIGSGEPLEVQGLDATATFLTAYETTSKNRLTVVISLKTGKGTGVSAVQATYRSSQGRQSQSTRTFGPNTLSSNSLANYSFVFPNASIGGTVTVTMYDDSFSSKGSVTIQTQ